MEISRFRRHRPTREHEAGLRSTQPGGRRRRQLGHGSVLLVAGIVAIAGSLTMGSAAAAASAQPVSSDESSQPDFGSNVYVFSPSMPQSQIQATVDAVAAQQVPNQFGTQRYALLFQPGTYGSAAHPLTFQVGYYTSVAGLGSSPGDVTINGTINVYNQCFSPSNCIALANFWRSLSNLTINVMKAPAQTGCQGSADFWATSQAAPVRRVHINGFFSLMDYCSGPSFASGGFIADSQFTGSTIVNGSQQQFLVRNSNLDGWTNGVWNQVFSGDVGAPAQSFSATSGHPGGTPPYTALATSPVTQEEPFLQLDPGGGYSVFVPAVQHNSVGVSWVNGATPGTSIPIRQFFIASPDDSVATINAALERGKNLILTPGVYRLDRTIEVRRPGTVVLGLGFPTLIPEDGIVSMRVSSVGGVKLSGMIFDAGTETSPVLLQVGTAREHDGAGSDRHSEAAEPTVIQDMFFRVGGAEPGRATASLVVNGNRAILDNIWAWRADHGSGVGWNDNTGDTGVIVNGNDVTAYGLFVEHYQKYEVIWRGQGGTDIFFQNEMPYDPPSQAAWMANSTTNGYAAFVVSPDVTTFQGYGMASYCFFNQGPPIHASRGFQVPINAGVQLHDVLTLFLSTAGFGGIDHVVNDTGGPVSVANPDLPSNVVSYP